MAVNPIRRRPARRASCPSTSADFGVWTDFLTSFCYTGLGPTAPPKLTFTPPFNSDPRGIFSTRAPFRPNPIGVSVVTFEGFDGINELFVRYLDCLDGTPLLDIKPYLATTDSEPEATMGWLDPHATHNRNTGDRPEGLVAN